MQVELFQGGHGLLEIDGSATIEPDTEISVLASKRPFRDGETVDVLVGDAVTGTFGTESLPSSYFVSSSLNYLPDAVQVVFGVVPFSDIGECDADRAIGDYLDRLVPVATGDLYEFLGDLQLETDPAEFDGVFQSLSPGLFDSVTRASLDVTRDFNNLLNRRMRSLRQWQGRGVPSLDGQFAPTGDKSGGSAKGLNLPLSALPMGVQAGPWMNVFGRWGERDSACGFAGYDQRTYGFALGYDTVVGENVVMGGALAYTRSDIDLNDGGAGSGGDIESFTGSLYGEWFTDTWWVSGSASYGFQSHDTHRRVALDIANGFANGDYDGGVFSATLGGGYSYRLGDGWRLEPYAGLDYIHLDEDGFRESGAGPVSLRVDDRSIDALYSELGIQLATELQVADHTVIPFVGLSWVHDFEIDDRTVTSGFTGASGTGFTLDGLDVDSDRLRIEVGVGAASGNTTMQLEYIGEFADGFDSHGVRASLGFRF